jgi:hypothetical protein
MLNRLKRFLFAGLLLAASPIHGFSSPLESSLLPLIPPGARIIGGVEDPRNPDTRGRLLIVTMKNSYDFDDCQSLIGVDTTRKVDEAIWVAASSAQGLLSEHLLLAAGRFDRQHIFQSAMLNGAMAGVYRGVNLLVVEPFSREQGQMRDTRWMAILDERTVVFGTSSMVQRALDRYLDRDAADPLVMERLSRLHPQVGSWNVLVLPRGALSKIAFLGPSQASWADLLGRDTVENVDELTLGIRFGSTARVDFVARTANNATSSFGAEQDARRRWFEASSCLGSRSRLEDLSIEPNLIRGSIVMPGKQLDACFKAISRASRIAPRGAGR